MDRHEEYDAARTAAEAIWDGMTRDELELILDEAIDMGCSDRFEILGHVDSALGRDLRKGCEAA